ncbi:MAG TPA: efflux RND transporter permease subunit, partial [Gemmataceae bacterium]
ALKPGSVAVEDLKRRLRRRLPDHLRKWVAAKWRDEGVPESRVAAKADEIRVSFEPADIISEVMSFGSPTPVEVVVSGTDLAAARAHAEKIRGGLEAVPALRDLQYGQALDYPAVRVEIDRERAGLSGVTAEDVADSVVAATSSTRFTTPNYWCDPKSGIAYQVQVEIPTHLVRSVADIETVPVKGAGGGGRLLRDVASVRRDTMPGEIDRYNMRRYVSLTANVEGADLGSVTRDLRRAIAAAGKAPAGVEVDVRGQVAPLEELFRGLGRGLVAAVAVIFLLLTAYFQSVRLALVALGTVPAVLLGVVAALLATGTTLNLQSFMGAIMAVGVAVAHAILLVTFAERERVAGLSARDAAAAGARGRVRPILMTSFAMIAGMLPMAVGFGEGGDQTAPLGRAVIGGLLFSTVTTLLVLPALFALVMGRAGRRSASLDPTDPHSPHYAPSEI